MQRLPIILIVSVIITLIGCAQKPKADLLIYNATVYTVDSAFSTAEAIVIANGKILATGTRADLEKNFTITEKLDASGRFIYPGFIDAHAHFLQYGQSLQMVNLVGATSWKEAVERVRTFADQNNQGWLIGVGWDQNDWPEKEFPSNEELNKLFPNRPVILHRVDGHAALANDAALQLGGVKAGMQLTGGDIEIRNNVATGILIDNAINLVTAKIPQQTATQLKDALLDAQKNCFAVGLTTVDDCGLNYQDVEQIEQLQKDGSLKMRLYVMLSDVPANYSFLDKKGIIKTDRLNVRGFKVYGDGALGSRGACLLSPYTDKPNQQGFLLSRPEHFDSVAAWISARDFQMCTHAIGDSGNRTILNIYAKYLKGKNDRRWRIEHAQVINSSDFALFGNYSIVPSVQPTHATSDMYWATDRLGTERVKGAYAFNQLMKQNNWIPLGTDFPVEDISPFKTFYAATIRKDAKGWPEQGYQMENALSREEALRGMTSWAARANFEETEKGSLEPGKLADFIILDRDIMKVNEKELLQAQVLKTFINGEKVYERK